MKKIFITLMCIVMVVCFMPTVAMAGGDAYTALKGDIESAPTDGREVTITLQGDITNMDTTQILTIKAGQNIVLNMDGHSITVKDDFNGRPIVNYGILKVIGNGTIDSTNSEFGGYGAINNFGNLTIENGTFKGHVCADGSAIYNRPSGTVIIENGYFEGRSAVYNGGTLTVNNGKFYTTSCNKTIDSKGGAGHWAYCINSHGNLIFNNGTVTGVQGALAIGGGTGLIYDGIFKTVICEHDSNGEPAHYAIYIAGETGGATATIYGGTYTAASKAAITVGNDNKDGDGGINEKASVQIKGGTFTSKEGVNVMLTGPSTGTPVITGGKFSNNGVSRQDSEVTVLKNYVPEGTDVVKKISGEFTLAPADNAVAQVGDAGFTTLQAAIDAATDGQTITLLNDVTVTETIGVTKNITLDLGRHDVTGNNCRVLNVKKGKLALTGSGTITAEAAEIEPLDPDSSVIRVGDNAAVGEGASKASAELIIGKDVIIAAPDTYGVTVFGSGTEETVTVYGTINATGTRAAISGNGSAGYGGTTINIEDDAEVTATQDAAIYHPQAGTLNINGGKISGTSGIEAKAGTINVTGTPTIEATGDKKHLPNGNGTSTSGYAIAVVDNAGYAGGTKADIKGGTFKGGIATLNDNQEVVENEKKGTIVVSGGSFNTRIDLSYLASGFVQSADGTVKVQAPTGGGGGGGAPAAQKPTVEAAEGIKVTLSTDGTTATITVEEGYEITDVTVNGVSKGAVTTVSGLKTGDKLAVKATKKDAPALTEEEQKMIDTIKGFKLTAKSKLTKLKNGKKAIRITWNKSKYQFDGVEVWRSTKRNSGYGKKPMWTIKVKSTSYYYNTAIKKGKTYYYKLRGYVEVNGQKYYTPFSNKAYRTVK